MPRKYRPWSREEYDLLERAILHENRRYSDVAAELGREVTSVRGAAQRIGISERRRHWRQIDWSPLDPMIIDMIECELMTVPQVSKRLQALGHDVHQSAIYRRLHSLPRSVRERAKRNGTLRRVSVGERVQRQRKAVA